MLLTSKFKIEVYEKLILIFSESKFVDTDLTSVDNEHLKSLIKHDKIPYSNWYTEHIRDRREVLNDYVDKYLDNCIENISLLPNDRDMFKHLMHQLKGQVDHAITIIRNYLPNMVWDSEIANIVVPYMIDHSEEFNSDVENQVIELCENNLKLRLMTKLVDKYKDNHDMINTLLIKMGEPYCNITDKGQKASFKKDDLNRELLHKLQKVGYISSYSIQGETIRVNHKRS